MVIELEEAEPKKPASDLVKEAREFLQANNAYTLRREVRVLLASLASELDQQITINETHVQNAKAFQLEQKIRKAAIDTALRYFERLGGRSREQVINQLRDAITPKGEQSSTT